MERLSKNFIWMAAANIVGSLFSLAVFIYLARTLMPKAFGYLSYVQTFVFYLANFVELGLTTYGIREIAKDRARASKYVSEIVSFRFFIAIILFILSISIIFLLHLPNLLKILIAESCLILFIAALATEWAFQGIEKMHMVFISFTTTTLLQLGLIYTYVKGPKDLLKVPIIYFVAAFPIIVIFLKRLNFKLMIRNLDFKKIKLYLSSSLIIWSISIFIQVYNSLDIVILGLFRSLEEVGYYTIARRIVGGATFIFIFLANAVLPRLSCTFSNDIMLFYSATKKFLRLAVILTILVFLPIIIFSKEFISLTVGSGYLPARLPLNIMLVSLILVLFNLPFSTGLIAACFEKEVLKQTIGCACLSVISNFILMPKYGMVGASISFLLTEAMALIWILSIYRKKIALNFRL